MNGSIEPALSHKKCDLLPHAALVLNAGLALALVLAWTQMARQGTFWAADFTGFYTGWAMVLDGRSDRLYDLDLQQEYQQRVAPELTASGSRLLFNYPPHAAVPAALLALLPRPAAFYAWDLVQLALLVPLVRFLRRLTPDRATLPFLVLLATVAAFPPLFISFQMGQVSLLVLVCLLGFVSNLERDKPFATAYWLALLTIKPQFLLAPAAILLAGRRWRELGIAAALFAVWALLASAILGWSCWIDFANIVAYLSKQLGTNGVHPLAMYNLKGFLTSVLGEASAAWINILSGAAVLLAVLVILAMGRKSLRLGTAEWDLRLALSLQLGLLVNPHFNPADVVTLIAPAILFYRGLRRCGHPARVMGTVLVCAPMLFALDCYGIAVVRPSAIHLFFVFMVGLAAAIVWTVSRDAQRSAGLSRAP
ncbi:MAG TPA: glycosyltransferase family 87 protein, partial [Gemmataceae bacterium]|nr:glycosyltransferase family 87 protein [Gemmataceae bacterium]